jgi:imidazolonepropionase
VDDSVLIKNVAQVPYLSAGASHVLAHAGSSVAPVLLEIAIEGGRITGVENHHRIRPNGRYAQVIDATGKIVIPGLIDSHTHLVFAGSRENEFEQRLQGKSYQEISASGGGINSTVACVRRCSKEELKDLARPRLKRLLSFGVTTVEVKSGYGLSMADELKCLEVIADLNAEGPVELVPTFLGAHAVPPEFQNNRDQYVRLLIDEMLPEVAKSRLAEFCDVFCDIGAFTLSETERIFDRARDLGLGLKLHADELSCRGGAELAARMGAVSADHLLQVSEKGIAALAKSGTVATLLPGTAFFLGLPYAPARRLLDRGVKIALASDCNPGTCPTENLPLIGTIACTQMKMLPSEVIAGLTISAAAAVGRSDRIGSLEVGKQADLVIFDVPNYQQLFYHFGVNHVWRVIKRGRVVYAA